MKNFMSEKHFKKAAKRLLREIKNYNYEPTHAQSLQLLAQALFDKPFEEIKETILSNKAEKSSSVCPSVILLDIASDTVLLVDGDYIMGDFPGSDLEIGADVVRNTGESIAAQKGVSIENYIVPIRDIDEYDTDDAIRRADSMGLLQNDSSLFKTLINPNGEEIVILVDDNFCPYSINDDWVDSVEEEGSDALIWCIECPLFNGGYIEHYVTFNELCNARYLGKNKWLVQNSHKDLIISIKK